MYNRRVNLEVLKMEITECPRLMHEIYDEIKPHSY